MSTTSPDADDIEAALDSSQHILRNWDQKSYSFCGAPYRQLDAFARDVRLCSACVIRCQESDPAGASY